MSHIKNYETTLKTTRLCLEPLMASHAAAMFRILSDEQLYRFTGDEPPESEVALEARYRFLTENGVRKIRCLINPNHMASQGVASNAGFNKSNVMEDGEEVWLV